MRRQPCKPVEACTESFSAPLFYLPSPHASTCCNNASSVSISAPPPRSAGHRCGRVSSSMTSSELSPVPEKRGLGGAGPVLGSARLAGKPVTTQRSTGLGVLKLPRQWCKQVLSPIAASTFFAVHIDAATARDQGFRIKDFFRWNNTQRSLVQNRDDNYEVYVVDWCV